MYIKNRFIFLLLSLMMISHGSWALVQTIGKGDGKGIRWSDSYNIISFRVHPSNDEGIDRRSMENVVRYSIEQWNGHGDVVTNYQMKSATDEVCDVGDDGTDYGSCNDIYFHVSDEEDPRYDTRYYMFGRSVLAIALVSYSLRTAYIDEADIIFNSDVDFSAVFPPTSGSYFFGDVLTHEIGHTLGFGHAQVHGSSMIYTSTLGQHSVHSDEKMGLSAIYSAPLSERGSRGELRGTVVGSSLAAGIWGAYIQAVASSTGAVVSSAVTDKQGRFSLPTLPGDDTYYLYIAPLLPNRNLPSYYDNFTAKFCPGGKDWRGGYYQKCGEGGHPQGFYLPEGSAVDVGTIGVRCGLKFRQPSESGGSDYTLNLLQSNGSVGEAVTAFFSDEEIAENTLVNLSRSDARNSHRYRVDLSAYEFDSTKELFLDIKIVAQALYSPLRTNVIVGQGDTQQMYPALWSNMAVATDGSPDFNPGNPYLVFHLDHSEEKIIRHPLDEANPRENVFSIEVVPQPLTQGLPSGTPSSLFLSGNSGLASDVSHYLMILSISERNSDGDLIPLEEKTFLPVSDNLDCLDDTLSVEASASEDLGGSKSNSSGSSSPLCGAVSEEDRGSPGGGFGVVLFAAFFLAWALGKERKKIKNTV